MGRWLIEFCRDERGATSIEYALIGSIVSIAIVTALHQMAPQLIGNYESVADAFNN